MRRDSSWKKDVQSPRDKRKKGRKEEERAGVCLESCELEREGSEAEMRGDRFA